MLKIKTLKISIVTFISFCFLFTFSFIAACKETSPSKEVKQTDEVLEEVEEIPEETPEKEEVEEIEETPEVEEIKDEKIEEEMEISQIPKDPIIKMKKTGIHKGRILLLGASYKSGVPMLSNSPSIKLRDLLKHEDYEVDIYDPKIEEFNKIPEKEEFDAIIITIDEPEFAEILKKLKTKLLLDYRMKFNE